MLQFRFSPPPRPILPDAVLLLALGACTNAFTEPGLVDPPSPVDVPSTTQPVDAAYLVARNNGGSPTGDDARLVAAFCLASQLPGAWSCEQPDLAGARCRGEDEGEVLEFENCAVQTTAGTPATSAIVCTFTGAAGDGRVVLPIFTGSAPAAIIVAQYHFDDDGYVDQCLLQDQTYRSIIHD